MLLLKELLSRLTDKVDSLVCLACTKAKMLQCLWRICCWKSGNVSRYLGFGGRFWFSYLSSLHNGQNTSIFTTAKSLFPTNTMLLKIPYNSAHAVSFSTRRQQCFWRMMLIGFFWHKRTPIIWRRPLNCRPLSELYVWFPKNFWVKRGKIHFYYSSISIHLSLFTCYYSWHCSLLFLPI